VAYIPDWESIADALGRVTATGVSEDEAKTDICRALADGKIGVRVRIAPTDYTMRGRRVFSSGNVGVPSHLKPDDFDWVQSKPFARWGLGPRPGEHYDWIGGWESRQLDLIELSTRDVIDFLCNGPQPPSRPPQRRAKPARERAIQAIQALYPNGVPDQVAVPNTSLCRRVGQWLKDSKLPDVKDDTVLRAAGRRK
jgi:hypothetical protein